jgi:signal transduction histidine kinase
LGRASVRLRTTAAAVAVVAVALLLGALVLVALMRDSLRDGLEANAEQRAAALAEQILVSGLPAAEPADDDDPDIVWQVTGADGTVLRSSQPLREPLPTEDVRETRLAGADHRYVVVTDEAPEHVVAVAASLEEVDDSTEALVTPLLIVLPLVLLLVGSTVWVVAGRALAPIERIRREAEEITGDRLDRRVPEPRSRDEVQRMARTMNQMLGRLEDARDRQQQFVADASHELRSPLASIRQAAEVARSHPGALREGDLADAVLEESARMQRLVEQLLTLTRAGDGGAARPHHDVDLDDLALAEARRVGRSGLDVETAGVGAGRVRGDRTALAQVVRNLVDNAVRHAEATMAVAVRETGGWVEIIVEDDGRGVPAGQRQRVFERFARLDEARDRDAGGSGLGLAIVKEIVTAHGGTVAVSSSATLGGARFVVRLPAPRTGG